MDNKEPLIMESTAGGLGGYFKEQYETFHRLKRAENCICGSLIAMSKELGIGDPDKVFHWGCPYCDPQVPDGQP